MPGTFSVWVPGLYVLNGGSNLTWRPQEPLWTSKPLPASDADEGSALKFNIPSTMRWSPEESPWVFTVAGVVGFSLAVAGSSAASPAVRMLASRKVDARVFMTHEHTMTGTTIATPPA